MDSQQITGSRAQKYAKQSKNSNDKPKKTSNPKKKYMTTLIVLSLIVCFILGTMIGYSLVGGGDVADVFNMETWVHLFNLIFG